MTKRPSRLNVEPTPYRRPLPHAVEMTARKARRANRVRTMPWTTTGRVYPYTPTNHHGEPRR